MSLQQRPPIITIMGHVDHGKTTLLDYIRKTNVTAREAGGITQHIGAYTVMHNGKPITFIDTPGHAAFNKMRERGANTTDIVILVVAANDGVKPQTVESIRHIKNANVPVVVAINKIDMPDIHPEIAKSGLAEHGILISEYGGDIEAVEISAKSGKNIDKLLETINLVSELNNIEADPQAPLEAVVIESSKDSKKGVVATVIVKSGTLSLRQDVFANEAEGRVKKLTDASGKDIQQLLPGFSAEVIGFKDVPAVGSTVKEVGRDYKEADLETSEQEAKPNLYDGIDFSQLVTDADKPKLNLIIKADVEGTLEAILQVLDTESTTLVSSGVGEITEQDLEMAETTNSLIIAFHIKISNKIKLMAKNAGVKIKAYDVIYKLIEDLQKQMLKLMEPTIDEVVTGEAEILQLFDMKGEIIAGCRVKTGEIKKTDRLHLKRNDAIIADPAIKNMMHGKESIEVAKTKNEFGMTFKNKKLDFKVGDTLVAFYEEDENVVV